MAMLSDDLVSPLPGANRLKPTFVHLRRYATYFTAGLDCPEGQILFVGWLDLPLDCLLP